jgi:hypothetical protein
MRPGALRILARGLNAGPGDENFRLLTAFDRGCFAGTYGPTGTLWAC